MTWHIYSEQRRLPLVPGFPMTVGRDATCDLLVEGPRVSRVHLTVEALPDGSVHVTDSSSNGTFTTNGRLTNQRVDAATWMALGAATGPAVVVTDADAVDWSTLSVFHAAAQLALADEVEAHVTSGSTPSVIKLAGVTRFGRASDNDVVLDGLLASPHHAHLLSEGGVLQVIDLASSRGTFVNGERIKTAVITPGDRVSMGGSAFVVSDNGLISVTESGGVSVVAERVRAEIEGAVLLRDVSFTLAPRTVTAVVGPSGSGKSTLLGAMTGTRPATGGQVLIAGADLYTHYDELRYEIGLVPQADLVPAQLKVREALEYAARLRFPRDTTGAERSHRIDEVLGELGLASRTELRIDRLSGGQRKRVSVALEMLTKPSVLFLDEPTSGLDPGLDRQVMVLLRELADSGRTVVVVTHAMENLGLADRLIVLAAGGYVAYDGPPGDAPAYFGARDMPGVFLTLEQVPGEEWARRQRELRGLELLSTGSIPAAQQLAPPRPSGAVSQLATLISRTIRVIVSDRAYASLLVILPLVLAVTGFLVGSSSGLGPSDGPGGFNPEARLLLLVLVLGGVFTGAATSIQELVKDRVIYQRERAVGLSRVSYILSKALVLGVIAAAHGFVFSLLALLGRSGPADSLVLPGHLEIAVIVAAAAVASCMLGLLLSALLPSREAALPVLVITTMVQVVLSGAIPLRFDWLLNLFGPLMAAYWAFRAMASSIGLDALLGPEASNTWPHETAQWWISMTALAVMSIAFVIATMVVTGRQDPGRRSR